jgi:hypothetical protein
MRLDQLSETAGIQLFHLLRHTDVPDFVKEAELDGPGGGHDLPDEAFADPKARLFPLDTPARVYVSNAFLQSKRGSLEEGYFGRLEARVKEAAELFSISHELEAYDAVMAKQAAAGPAEDPVCVISEEDGREVPLFPVKTAEDLRQAAAEFEANLPSYPFGWRRDIARGFLRKSAELGVEELPDIICKYAGLFFPAHTSVVAGELGRRSRRMATKTAAERLQRLSEALDGANFAGREEVFKLATLVQHIEQQDGAYDRAVSREALPDPVDLFFPHSPQKTAGLLDTVTMGDRMFHMEQLRKVPASIYKEAFGVALDPADPANLREVLPTMPRSDVDLFQELSGAVPVT